MYGKKSNQIALDEIPMTDEIAKADYNHRFQVPEDARWEAVQNTAIDIGLKLNEVFEKSRTPIVQS